MKSVIEKLSRTYLPMKNNTPHQTKCQFRITIDNVIATNIDQFHLKYHMILYSIVENL